MKRNDTENDEKLHKTGFFSKSEIKLREIPVMK